MMIRLQTLVMAAALAVFSVSAAARERPPVVLAAASMQESLNAVADRWASRGHARPVLSFAASSALARQLMSGAPADLFLSADEAWMDALAGRGRVVRGSRIALLANRLVLVARCDRRLLTGRRWRDLPNLLGTGRIALADPGSVPAGRYAAAALRSLGLWRMVAPHVVAAENVRAALALVERGAAPFGIVYATDARASRAACVVGRFPAASHPPIVYPLARLTGSTGTEAEAFRRYLMGPEAQAIFRRFGFEPHR